MQKLISLSIILLLISCDSGNDMDPATAVPSTYSFIRNGQSSVDFSGQSTRLSMLTELKNYMKKGDAGQLLETQKMLNMFSNQNNPFIDEALNVADKQLENKTLISDIPHYKELFAQASATSADYVANLTTSKPGVSGRIQRGTSTNYILTNEKGWEYTQIVEKGLMGSLILHQILNTYLTDEYVGESVENIELEAGANYTTKEHHWDEAFGYWGVPVDFSPEGTNLFWGNYTLGNEGSLGSAAILKNAYLTGRTAIVNQNQPVLDAQREILYAEFERVVVATCLHYLNEAISDLNNGDTGNAFHHLSEGYGFARALRISPVKKISNSQIDTLLNEHFGSNSDFWTVSVEGLQSGKSLLASVYTEFEAIKDDL